MATAGLSLYRLVTRAAEPLVPSLLKRRIANGKEEVARINERLGYPERPRPPGPLVWLHGASIGETLSLMPLVSALSTRGLGILLTSGTVTSAEIAASRLPAGAIHQYVPVDTPGAARRFIAHWRPDAALFAESELWPNLILTAHAAGVKLAIVNGRMSERSAHSWQRLPRSIARVLGAFDVCLAQSEADADRYRRLGAAGARFVGNLKFDGPAPHADAAMLADLRQRLGTRPVLVAASTHPGEDEVVLAAHLAAEAVHPGLITVLAPRHPQRGDDIERLARSAGLAPARRSRQELPDADTRIYIADTVGELGLFYRLGRLAVLGGSFIAHGGQNPIEPAKLGVAVLHGPHVFNFTDVYAAFDAAGGAELVADPDRLGHRIAELLGDATRLGQMQKAAEAVATDLSGALGRTLEALAPLLPRVPEQCA